MAPIGGSASITRKDLDEAIRGSEERLAKRIDSVEDQIRESEEHLADRIDKQIQGSEERLAKRIDRAFEQIAAQIPTGAI